MAGPVTTGIGLPYPRSFPGWAISPMPGTGPARIGDCLPVPVPGRVKHNGVLNPYIPYGGETYAPASETAAIIQARSCAGGGLLAAGGSSVAPRSMAGGSMCGSSGGGGSVMSYASTGLGGRRLDDGWDGSLGRASGDGAPWAPDMSSTAGALPRAYQLAAGWVGQYPSSPLNHARMSPSLTGYPGMSPTLLDVTHRASPPPPTAYCRVRSPTYLQPPVAHRRPLSPTHLQPPVAHHRPRRATSVRAIPIDEYCPECCPARSTEKVGTALHIAGHQRRRGLSAVSVGSSLRPAKDVPMVRKVSKTGRSATHSSECTV